MCNLKSGHFLQNKIGIYEYIIGFLGGIYKVLWAEKIDIIDTFRWIFLVIFKKMLVRAERLYTWNLKIASKIFIFESLRKVESLVRWRMERRWEHMYYVRREGTYEGGDRWRGQGTDGGRQGADGGTEEEGRKQIEKGTADGGRQGADRGTERKEGNRLKKEQLMEEDRGRMEGRRSEGEEGSRVNRCREGGNWEGWIKER